MLLLALLPIFVLILAILMIRAARGLREAQELRALREPLMLPEDHRRPSDDFHDRVWLPLCQRVEDAAVARLNRPLSEKERRRIWRSRSELVLEVALKEIAEAPSSQHVGVLLATLPTGIDRPDPTGWCGSSTA